MRIKHSESFPIWLPANSRQLQPNVFSAFNLFLSMRRLRSEEILRYMYNRKLKKKGINTKKLYKLLRVQPRSVLVMSEKNAEIYKKYFQN